MKNFLLKLVRLNASLVTITLLYFISSLQFVHAFDSSMNSEPIKVTWRDLQGAVAPYENPFTELTDEQIYNLSVHARILEMQKVAPDRVTQAMADASDVAKQQLVVEKVDINYLLEQRFIIMEKRKQAAFATNDLLANKTIELGGYMLSLSFDNGLVSEFLLVPTIGACSHKPVPPANQIILVNTKKPVLAGAPYEPITVTGTLRLTPQAKDLYLVDGEKNIEMSYTLEDTKVEPYKSIY